LRDAPDLRRGGGGTRAGARPADRSLSPGRPLPRPQLRARDPVDELRTAGLSPAPHHVDDRLPRHPRRPRLGAGRLAPRRGERAGPTLAPGGEVNPRPLPPAAIRPPPTRGDTSRSDLR